MLAEAFDFPHGLSREEAEYRFFYKLSQLYIDGKITKDDGNELIHYGLYYSPNNKSGHYVDIKGVENFPQFGR